jgi:carbamoyl-phosphate synthase large subunit
MKLLLTGAGGPAAISVWKSLYTLEPHHTLYMADMDARASGLYLVPEERRFLVPRGDDANFADALLALCRTQKIDACISTVDAELAGLAARRSDFAAIGVQLVMADAAALALCRDKALLIPAVAALGVPVPAGGVWQGADGLTQWSVYPAFAKPCKGSGSSGLMNINNPTDLAGVPRDGSYLLQELLPHEEYSVDVYAQPETNGAVSVLAAVVRERMKTDSGIAVTARTRQLPVLQALAAQVVEGLGLPYVSNVQFKRDVRGEYKFLEVNPRFPGSLPLTAMAGIDIPKLMLHNLLGHQHSVMRLPYQEVMMVRYWTEHAVDPQAYDSMAKVSLG